MTAPDEPETTADAPEAGSRRVLLVAGAALAVVVLGAVAFLLLGGGGDEEVAPAAKPSSAAPPVSQPAPAAPLPAVAKPSDKGDHAFRDPFQALLVAGTAGGTTGGVTAPVGTTTVGGTTTTTGGTTTGTTTTGTTGTTTGTTGVTATSPVNVKVLSVTAGNSSGRVTVKGKAYSVAVGDEFATYFKVLRFTNGRCGTFQYGDERFDLCEGETAKMQ
jgi:hypothetical protein